MADSDQLLQIFLIPTQLLKIPEDFPVLRGLKMILCSLENTQLLGQTYCSDGAPSLQPRWVQKAAWAQMPLSWWFTLALYVFLCTPISTQLAWVCNKRFNNLSTGTTQTPKEIPAYFLVQLWCFLGSFTSRAKVMLFLFWSVLMYISTLNTVRTLKPPVSLALCTSFLSPFTSILSLHIAHFAHIYFQPHTHCKVLSIMR